jgi:hypothetical protein
LDVFKVRAVFYVFVIALAGVVGCRYPATSTIVVNPIDTEAEIRANWQHLDPADQLAVEQQRFCPVMPDVRLGEMGPPQKMTIDDVTFFVCCERCSCN